MAIFDMPDFQIDHNRKYQIYLNIEETYGSIVFSNNLFLCFYHLIINSCFQGPVNMH